MEGNKDNDVPSPIEEDQQQEGELFYSHKFLYVPKNYKYKAFAEMEKQGTLILLSMTPH